MAVEDVVAATAAGIATTVVGHPLDTVKVHLQAGRTDGSAFAVANHLLRTNLLFRGILPPLFNAVVMNACMFSVFAGIESYFAVTADNSNNNSNANNNNNNSFHPSSLLAGLVSGLATACISTPTDFIKVQAQLNGIRQLSYLRSASFRTVYTGHVANLAREGLFTAVYLGVYSMTDPQGFWQVASVASATGGLAWIVSYPFDTVKTVKQAMPNLGYRKIVQRGGLTKGCAMSTGRAMLVTSLRMVVYDAVRKHVSTES